MSTDSIHRIQAYLEQKSSSELIALLLELVREMDEPTRQQFWTRLAPPGMATADLRYPSAEDFLAELEAFAAAVDDGKYYDEDAASYFAEDDDEYYYNDYGDPEDEYDPADHKALKALRNFLAETSSYFDAGRYEVAARAYAILLEMLLEDAYETLGVPTPIAYLDEKAQALVENYFVALQRSAKFEEFLAQVLNFLEWHAALNSPFTKQFFEILSPSEQADLRAYLEKWVDKLERPAAGDDVHPAQMRIVPFRLEMLLHIYAQDGQNEAAYALWARLRKRCLPLYVPLLAAAEEAQNWPAVLEYGNEALSVAEPPPPVHLRRATWPMPDPFTVRTHLAHAYAAVGQAQQAFEMYLPVFEGDLRFATYAQACLLAENLGKGQRQQFVDQTIQKLQSEGAHRRYLLCQVYLSEQRFDDAYQQVVGLKGYTGMNETKLVAKAHLLAALGPQPDERMGANLCELYSKVETSDNDATQFLRRHDPLPTGLSRAAALQRTEGIYERLMQAHIDNGRKTYATAAYYCALLGEIAAHEGRLPAFVDWYDEFMQSYKRFRALRSEMEAKVGPVLKMGN